MALTTYSGLSTGVFSRLNRTADSTVFDNCISLAESEINRRLALKPVRPMHTRNAAFSITGEYVAVPTGLLDVDSFKIVYSGDSFVVKPTSTQNMNDMFEANDTTARPVFYAQVGTDFRFYPEPDTTYTATLIYWLKVPNLTSGAPTNWLLTSHPDVYFHGVLAHAYEEYFDEKNADKQGALFDAAMQKVLDAYPNRPDHRPLKSDISENQLSGLRTVLV